MKYTRLLFTALSAALFLGAWVSPVTAKTIRMFPIAGDAIEAQDHSSITRLFRDAVESRSPGDSVTLSGSPCGERDCALNASRTEGYDASTQLVYSNLFKLGSRWIFSATILNADGSNSFSQRLTARSIEDMEAITLRMADALIQRRTIEQVATLDNITEKEQDKQPERRLSHYSSGVALGYMFPAGSSFQYLNYDGLDTETHGYRQMIRLTWLNSWDFRNNLSLGADLVWNMPSSFGADASLRYMFGRGDFTPFVGGGLGLHYVKGDENSDLSTGGKRNSGPAVNVQGGMLMFRTYDVNVMLRGQYQVIFNSDVDHGMAVDVGVTFGNKNSGASGHNANAQSDDWNALEYIGAAFGTLLLIGILAN